MRLLKPIIVILLNQSLAFTARVQRADDVKMLESTTECHIPGTIKSGYCVPVRNCMALLNQLYEIYANNASEVIQLWKCGPRRQHLKLDVVCCNTTMIDWNPGRNETLETTAAPINSRITTTASNINTVEGDPPLQENSIREMPKSSVNIGGCGKQSLNFPSRILGGSTALEGEFPWLARLIWRTDDGEQVFACTGALITSKIVLTAAHCLISSHNMGSLYAVNLGESDINCKTQCPNTTESVMIDKYIAHPSYKKRSKNHDHDIGLIFLREAVAFNEYISPICLLENPENVTHYYISGWGKTESQRISVQKLKATLPLYPKDQCIAKYKTLHVDLSEGQICAGGVDNKDSCQGDSGGPLMLLKDTNTWFVRGVVSFGVGCGRPSWPGVYIDVPKYMQWIKTTIAEN